jgi:hypothetical protein
MEYPGQGLGPAQVALETDLRPGDRIAPPRGPRASVARDMEWPCRREALVAAHGLSAADGVVWRPILV